MELGYGVCGAVGDEDLGRQVEGEDGGGAGVGICKLSMQFLYDLNIGHYVVSR